MTKPLIVGTVITKQHDRDDHPMYWLTSLETLDGRPLMLPLSGHTLTPQLPLSNLGLNITEGDLVELRINVVPDNHIEVLKRGKPFAMNGFVPARKLKRLSDTAVVRDKMGAVLIEESVWESEKAALVNDLAQERHNLETEAAVVTAALKQDIQRLTKDTDDKNAFLLSLNEAIERADDTRKTVEAQVSDATQELSTLNKRKEHVMAAYQQMHDFAKERSSLLLSLDLISDEQYRIICGDRQNDAVPTNSLSWQEDLGMNYGRAVSTIHAYLLSQGIIYPRWLVGNFLTLLRMNDLIILSGLSGAGKTQIVRSFAEALGGVAHVMPVKPNWTGAEDLLGFFNPLQRSYVRTPFLEALLAASRDPGRLHLICLDEMNLARAEYYFADFLSALEDRSRLAEIPLYSESEASHIQAEVRMLLAATRGSGLTEGKMDSQPQTLETMLQRPEVMAQLRSMFGESAAESFPAFHGRVRRALSTVLDIPSKVLVPNNVRFIGAINVDQTTYGLSPKILDRAHVVRFENPLKYPVADIRADAARHMPEVPRVAPLHMPPDAFMPQRCLYPEYKEEHPAAKWLHHLYCEYLSPLGLDVAFRTIRQAQMYWDRLAEVGEGDASRHDAVAKNLIVLQKILPKFTIDGKTKAKFRQETTPKERWEIVRTMEQDLQATAEAADMHPNMQEELHRMRMAAEANDKIFNYWA